MSTASSTSPSVTSPEAIVLDTPDTITVNRALPLVGGANVPTPPAGFRQSEGDVKRSLSKVAETQRAEVLAALGEAAAKGPKLQADLGPYAPPAAKGEALLQRAVVLRDGKQRALDLLAYYEELEDINNHDVMNYLGEVRGELLHVADRNPLLKREYSALMSLIIQRREIILEGRARARSNQPESTPPTEGKGK